MSANGPDELIVSSSLDMILANLGALGILFLFCGVLSFLEWKFEIIGGKQIEEMRHVVQAGRDAADHIHRHGEQAKEEDLEEQLKEQGLEAPTEAVRGQPASPAQAICIGSHKLVQNQDEPAHMVDGQPMLDEEGNHMSVGDAFMAAKLLHSGNKKGVGGKVRRKQTRPYLMAANLTGSHCVASCCDNTFCMFAAVCQLRLLSAAMGKSGTIKDTLREAGVPALPMRSNVVCRYSYPAVHGIAQSTASTARIICLGV
jgi:hypothetical protein